MVTRSQHEVKPSTHKMVENICLLDVHGSWHSDWDGTQMQGPAGSFAPCMASHALASPSAERRETSLVSGSGSTLGSDQVDNGKSVQGNRQPIERNALPASRNVMDPSDDPLRRI